MKAVILVAGAGSRLGALTADTPKSLLPIAGASLAERTVELLRRHGVRDIAFVVGFRQERFREAFPWATFFENADYERTDQAASALRARGFVDDDALIIAGDLLLPEPVLADMLAARGELVVAVDFKERPFDDAIEKVRREDGAIRAIGKLNVPNDRANGEFLGITRVAAAYAPTFFDYLAAESRANPRGALIHAHQRHIDAGRTLSYVECRSPWVEVDDPPALAQAEQILSRAPSN